MDQNSSSISREVNYYNLFRGQNNIKNKFYCCLRKFIRKINNILLKNKKTSYRKFSSKTLSRIIDANEFLLKLTPNLRDKA